MASFLEQALRRAGVESMGIITPVSGRPTAPRGQDEEDAEVPDERDGIEAGADSDQDGVL